MKILFRLMALSTIWVFFAANISAAELAVSGLSLPRVSESLPDQSIGLHPLAGPLSCPAFFHFDASKSKYESNVFSNVDADSLASKVWKLTVRTDLKWWNGDAVSTDAIVESLTNVLAETVRGTSLTLPSFKVSNSGTIIHISFDQKPPVGAYALAGWPLFRKAKKTNGAVPFECVGSHAIAIENSNDILLKPVRGGGDTIRLTENASSKQSDKTKMLNLRFANSYGGTPWTRMSDEAAKCQEKIDTPFFTYLRWNRSIAPTDNPEFRKILTRLTPRGEILRAAAGSVGDLVSAPISRSSQGYNKKVLVPNFDLRGAAKELDAMGFKRPSPDSPRRLPNGREFTVKIRMAGNAPVITEKTIEDTLTSVGLSVQLLPRNDSTPEQEVTGAFAGAFVSSPEYNLLKLYFPRPPLAFASWSPEIPDLYAKMLAYHQELTYGQVSWTKLQEIHSLIGQSEPLTPLLQNWACIDANFKINNQALNQSFATYFGFKNLLGI
jgi:hypothetical protein